MNKTTKEKIYEICTYHSELGEGTSGYCLSNEQFEKLFDLFTEERKRVIKEVKEIVIKDIEDLENHDCRLEPMGYVCPLEEKNLYRQELLAKLSELEGEKSE